MCPYYDPAVVYGSWPYPAYPPYYFGAPGYIATGVIATGIAFGAGYAVGRWVGGRYWGGGFNWGGNNININRNISINNINRGNGNNWVHNPVHRQGVRYSNADVAAKFGGNRNIAGGAQNRMDFRGRNGQQVLRGGAGPGGAAGAALGGAAGAALGGAAGAALGGNRPNGRGEAGAGRRPNAGNRTPSGRPSGGERTAGKRAASRPAGVAGRGPGNNAFGNIGSGRQASIQAARGRESLGGGGRVSRGGGAGGARLGGGFGGGRGGGFGGGRGGGRRSDVRLKHDITLLGHLDNGIGFYRFIYNGGHTTYVGVMAQEVQAALPGAVVRGSDGYLRVFYDKLGLKFQTYDQWIAEGARIPAAVSVTH